MTRRHRLVRTWLVAVLVAAAMPALFAQRGASLQRFVGQTASGLVTAVVDGDTIRVRLDEGGPATIRLEGIDTPERGEPFSNAARNATRVLLFDKRVRVRGTDVDRYGRLVARVTVGNEDSSVALVGQGLACHFTRYSADPVLAAAQRAAQARGAGFWAPGQPKPACTRRTNAAGPSAGIGGRPAARSAAGPFHGNTNSRVFHAPDCRNYDCAHCTVVFNTADDAVRAGFRPAGDCIGRR